MINISLKDASALDRALQKLVDDAEQATMGAVKGLVGYALAYIVPRTPQWSGELVAQWRVTAAGAAAPRYRSMGYKDSVEAPWPVPKDYDELDPYHATRNPNDMAMLDARERTEADLRALVQSKALLRGATIWLPYTYDGEDIDGLGRFSNATRHPGFSNALDRLDTNLSTRYKKISKSQAAAMLKTPIPWAQQDRLAQQAYTYRLGVQKDDKAREREAKRVEKIQARAGERYEAKRTKRAEKARKAEEIKRIRSEISAMKKTRRIVKRRVSSEGKRTELSALERKIADLDAQLSVLQGLESKPTNVDKSKSRPQPQKKNKSPVQKANDKPQSGSILDTFVFNANKRR